MQATTLNHISREGDPHLIRVLMYHRIVDDEQLSRAHWTCVHVENFRRQLEFLDTWGFTPITFHDYRLFSQGKLNLPRKPVMITFDDGYLDAYQYAFPLLQEFGMKATVFAIGEPSIQTNHWDTPIDEISEAPLMNAYHIKDMHAAGFEIGAHTMTHPKLGELTADQAWVEISQSRKSLEQMLGVSVRSFCYPYGSLNDTVKKLVEQAGYEIAYSVYSGPVKFGGDVYEIRRTPVYGMDNIVKFGIKMLMPYHYLEWSKWKMGRYLVNLKNKIKKNNTDIQENDLHIPYSLEIRRTR